MGFAGLAIGTLVFALLGVGACFLAALHVAGQPGDRATKREHRQLGLLVVGMSAFCMWLHWACAYMHQMNPILPPLLEEQ